ncbi:MAG: PAS domain S-box protein [Bacteroidia bacterium]|nr:PAS domain S-box protein [Bacteroidia bacterium]
MVTTLFELDFSRWDVILMSLMPAIINLGIFIYILFFLQQNLTNYIFALFVFLAGFCQISDGLVRMSVTQETALEWSRISGSFLLFVSPFGILFTLSVSKSLKYISNRFIFISLFLPPAILLLISIARLDKYSIISSETWHWIVNPLPFLTTKLIYIWISGTSLVMLGLLWFNFSTAKNDPKKHLQLLLLAIGFSIPVTGGIILEVILPLLFGMDDIPLSTPLFTTFSVCSLIAIKKYGLFEYSPKHKWDQIIESMNEGIIIVDADDRIMYSNKMFYELLGYKEHEIIGKIAYELFQDDEEMHLTGNIINERKTRKSAQYETRLKSKSGEKIWLLINASPYTDNTKKIIGSIVIHTNINREKKVEALFRALVENVGDIFSLTDKDGVLVYVSKAIEKVTGFTPEEVKGKPASFLMHPDFIKESEEILRELLKNPGVSIPRINRFLHKKGHYVWVEGTVTNLLHDPNIHAIVTNYRDITERREAEERIIQSEENLHAIFENTSEGFVLTDVNGIVKYFNHAAKKMILNNIEKEAEIGNSIFNFIEPGRKNYLEDIITKVLNGETIQYDGSYHQKDGLIIWHDFTVNPVIDDTGVVGICFTGRDITSRIAAEELKSLIMNSSLDAIVCMDIDGLITLWNPSAEKIFGWNEKEVHGKRISDIIIPEQYRQRHEDGFRNYLKTGVNRMLNKVWEITALNQGQKEFPVELSIIPIKQENKVIFCAFIKDISERKEAEEKLRNNEEHLRIIIDNEPECVKTVDLSGALLEMNPAGLSLLGVQNIKDIIGKKATDFVHPEDKEIYADLHNRICNGETGTADYRMLGIGQTQKWMESNAVPLKNINGEVYAVLSVARDITEIKKSQEQLINNEKRFRTLVENGADAVVILSAEGNPLYVSSSIEKVIGYSESEAMQQNLLTLAYPDDIAFIKKVMQEALANPGKSIPGYTGRLKHKDGTWHWYESTITNMLHDPAIAGIIKNFRDITERKESEDRISESEANLKAIFENTSEGFFLIDMNHVLKAFNNKAKEIITLNHHVKNELQTGLNFFTFIEESRHEFFRNAIFKIMEGETVNYNRSYVQKNGNTVWLNYSIIPVIDDNRISGYCITAHDITHQKNAELQKEFDSNNLNALINNTNNLMWSVDHNLCLITSNSAYEAQHKLFTGQVVRKGESVIVEHMDKDTLERWKANYKRALDGETFTIMEHVKLMEEWWIEVSFYPVKKGNEVIGTACYGHNITERKKFEKEFQLHTDELLTVKNDLEHKEIRLKQAQEIAHVGNWEVNFESNEAKWSDEAYRIYGLIPGTHIHAMDSWLSFVHHEDIDYVNHEIIQSQKACSNFSFYHRIVHPDEMIRYVFTEGRYEFKSDETPVGIYGVVHDVTDEHIVAEKLLELNARLEKRAHELVVSNQELEQFAYIASHDLQEPLRMVTGFLTQLNNKYKEQLDDRAKEYIYYATDGAVRMRQIILDLLEYSRVGRKEFAFEPIDMNELVNQTVQLNRTIIEEKGAVIEWNNLATIRGSGITLQQILQNLIVNALKYQKDEVTPVIKISSSETAHFWQFAIKDNGIGIEEKFFDKIFIVFQRLHNREKYSGTGIGLAICKKIVENHNGRLWVESKIGEGCTFYFTISKKL